MKLSRSNIVPCIFVIILTIHSLHISTDARPMRIFAKANCKNECDASFLICIHNVRKIMEVLRICLKQDIQCKKNCCDKHKLLQRLHLV